MYNYISVSHPFLSGARTIQSGSTHLIFKRSVAFMTSNLGKTVGSCMSTAAMGPTIVVESSNTRWTISWGVSTTLSSSSSASSSAARTICLDAGTVGMKDYDDVGKEVVVGKLVSAVAAWHVAFVLFGLEDVAGFLMFG